MSSDIDLGVSAPWYRYVRRIYAIFSKDPDIPKITYDKDANEVKLFVTDGIKAASIAKILPSTKTFGSITLKITVVPANHRETLADIYRKAFTGNPVFKNIIVDNDTYSTDIAYFLFKEPSTQYFNDRIDHPANIETALYEDIARDLFEDNCDGIFFGTYCPEVVIWP